MKKTEKQIRVLWDGDIQGDKPCGGISRYCEGILGKLGRRAGLDIMAVCPKKAPAFRVSAPNLRQISMQNIPVLDQFRLNGFHADIFHSVHYQTSPVAVAATVQTVLDFIDRRLPVFYSNRDGFIERQSRLLQEAQGVVAISESTRKDAIEYTGISEEKIIVAYPGVSPVFQKTIPDAKVCNDIQQQTSGGAPFLLWVGPRNGYKNFSTFFHAFATLAKKLDIHLVLVGGEFPRLSSRDNAKAISEGICDRVHARMHVQDEELRHLYAASAGLVQASLWEGFGIPLVEALSCGSPLLVSDIPVFKEVAGEHARYVDPTDPEAWMEGILSHMESAQRPSSDIKNRIGERFSPCLAASRIHTFYQQLLK